MRSPAKTRLAGTSVAILAWLIAGATSAFAQTADPGADPGSRDISNTQVQLGDVFASQVLDVTDATQVNSQATAVANTVSAIGQNGALSLTSSQSLNGGTVTASAAASTTGSAGDYAGVTASATGNTGTAGTCCGITSGSATQTIAPGAAVISGAFATLGAPAGQLSADSLSVGNTQGWLASNGDIRSATTQSLQSVVQADTEVTADVVTGPSGASATAIGNDVTVSATNSPVDIQSTQTTQDTAVLATLTVQQQAGDTIAGQATATGNNVSVQNDGFGADTAHTQVNGAVVTADAAYGLGTWNSASVGAYGVGNSILLSNQGPSVSYVTDQTNTGAVTAKASLLGGGGADSTVNATAVGNAVTANICSTCDGGVGATNRQSNSGGVSGTSVYRGPQTGSVVGAASAVGNSATYVVKSSGG